LAALQLPALMCARWPVFARIFRTRPAFVKQFRIVIAFLIAPVVLNCSALATDVLTNRGDNARTGLNSTTLGNHSATKDGFLSANQTEVFCFGSPAIRNRKDDPYSTRFNETDQGPTFGRLSLRAMQGTAFLVTRRGASGRSVSIRSGGSTRSTSTYAGRYRIS